LSINQNINKNNKKEMTLVEVAPIALGYPMKITNIPKLK
jgi:hypothetical protein